VLQLPRRYRHVFGGGGNACVECHKPHGAKGSFLWPTSASTDPGAQTNLSDGTLSTSSAIKPLCYSCHDGTATSLGLATVFNSALVSHRTRAATQQRSATGWTDAAGVSHPLVNADGSIKLRTNADGSPYLYGAGRDCDLCHDPHETSDREFIRYQRIGSTTVLNVGGNICSSCHSGDASTAPGANGYMENHKVESVPTAANAPADPATRLWLANAAGVWVPTALADGGKMQCMTCHTPHGAPPDYEAEENKVYDVTHLPYTGGGTAPVETRTYTINAMTTAGGALCLNCH